MKKIKPLHFIVFLIAALTISVSTYTILNPEGFFNLLPKASTPTGVTSISLNPSTATFTVNQQASIDITLNTAGYQIDGLQIFLNVDPIGNISISDTNAAQAGTQIQAASVPGLSNVTNTVEGNLITFASITSSPTQPYTSNNQSVTIATIAFTPTQAGSFSLNFNPTQTIITQNQTATDILLTPTNGSYTITEAATSPSPSPTAASASPSPSPSASSPLSSSSPSPSPSSSSTYTTTTTSSSLASCQESCSLSIDCQGSLICSNGKCVNSSCPSDSDCYCTTSKTSGTTSTTTSSSQAPATTNQVQLPQAGITTPTLTLLSIGIALIPLGLLLLGL